MLKLKNDTFYITTTRFNNDTFYQNQRFRMNNNITGCVYGTPHEMPSYIPINGKVFVFEMNNSKNQIEGIGSVRKRALLNHFGSARAVESASLEEIRSVEGVEEKVAKKIYNFFHE